MPVKVSLHEDNEAQFSGWAGIIFIITYLFYTMIYCITYTNRILVKPVVLIL